MPFEYFRWQKYKKFVKEPNKLLNMCYLYLKNDGIWKKFFISWEFCC